MENLLYKELRQRHIKQVTFSLRVIGLGRAEILHLYR